MALCCECSELQTQAVAVVCRWCMQLMIPVRAFDSGSGRRIGGNCTQ